MCPPPFPFHTFQILDPALASPPSCTSTPPTPPISRAARSTHSDAKSAVPGCAFIQIAQSSAQAFSHRSPSRPGLVMPRFASTWPLSFHLLGRQWHGTAAEQKIDVAVRCSWCEQPALIHASLALIRESRSIACNEPGPACVGPARKAGLSCPGQASRPADQGFGAMGLLQLKERMDCGLQASLMKWEAVVAAPSASPRRSAAAGGVIPVAALLLPLGAALRGLPGQDTTGQWPIEGW